MLKVEVKKVEVSTDIDEISISNIMQCDKFTRKDLLMCSMIGWLNNDKTRNYQSMELMLRGKGCKGYLIAKPVISTPNNMRLTMPNDNKQVKTHELDLTFDHNEIIKYYDNYEDNFANLKNAGCYAYKNNPDEELIQNNIEASKQDIKFNENNVEYNLTQNTIYLTLKQMNKIETVDYVSECMENKFGKKPDRTVAGTINYKNMGEINVYTLTIDNKTICECAWVNLKNGDVDLIDLRNVKMEFNDK